MNPQLYELRIKRMYVERAANIERVQPAYWHGIRIAAAAFVERSKLQFRRKTQET